MMIDNYTILHLHTMDSNPYSGLEVDSVTGFKDYINKIKECGMKAVAFTEHGSILRNVAKKQLCEKNGIKFILGEEFYITENIDPDNLVRDNYHCILLAKNQNGAEELANLSSVAFEPDGHFYYNPRISLDELINTSDNILILTACVSGILCRGTETVKRKFSEFLVKNKHRCWLEIQPHDFDLQKQYNRYLFQCSLQTGIPLVATSDIHALNEEHLMGRKIMQQAKKVEFKDEDQSSLVFQDLKMLINSFEQQHALPEEVYLNAINETNKIADLIEEYELDYSNKYPRFENAEDEFKKRINAGIIERGINKLPNYKEEYLPRIKEEFETYKHNDAIDFMLLDSDYKNWMRKHGMNYGPSRGSVSGSLIAYLCHNTDVDSVKYDLNFSRFMSPDRVSLSDVDTDIYSEDRYKVREYFFNRDDMYCCNILTFNTIKMRGAIKDVGRALGYTPDQTQAICNQVYEDENGKEILPEKVIKDNLELYKYVNLVINTITSLGRHAAGIVCSPINVRQTFGTLHIKTDPRPVSQVDMHEIDSLNYVKMDLLGLNAVGLINEACKLAGIPYRTMDNTDLNDENVIRSIAEDTTMIFQFESGFASDCLKRMLSEKTMNKIRKKNPNVSYLDLFSMVNGVIRPAGESFRDQMLNGELRDNGNKALNDFLSPTLGYLTYQEQIIEFLHSFCGFTMGQADIVRRCIDEDTLVTIGNGNLKPIKDIKIGDNVVTYSQNGATITKRVNKVFDNGIQECIEILTKQGNRLICTPSHKILTQNGFIEVGLLSNDDYVMVPSRIITDTDNLRPNQRLSSDTMFMLGLLIGDGCVFGDYLHYVNHEDVLIQKYMECVNGLLRRPDKCEFIISENPGVNVETVYTVNIKSENYKNSLIHLLDKFDMRHRASEKYIPNQFMSYPMNEKLLNFIAGLFNADGGYNTNSVAIEYSSISKLLVLQIRQLLLRLGICSSYYPKYVKNYDYYCYTLFINDVESMVAFKEHIIPYMIGKKRSEFEYIIDKAIQVKQYSYLLPSKYRDEIIKSAKEYNKSIRELAKESGYDLEIKKECNSITNTKAEYFCNKLFCPETYKILYADYIPVQISSIVKVGEKHVYDLEIEENHNYIAGNIIVHNCFAKKTGTQDVIPIIKNGGYMTDVRGNKDDRYIKGFIAVAQEKYGMTREQAENVIIYFLKVIDDASSYLFSKNHAVPYSAIGLFIGWLRYYYPIELFTAALNIYQKNKDKMNNIISYVKSKGYEIKPIKFGKSRAGYFMDKSENCIYQGIEAIKECNGDIAEELYQLRNNKYNNFIELLKDIKNTTVKKNQLDILIKLEFFSDFGSIDYLLGCVEIFDKYYGKVQIRKEKALEENLDFDLLRECSNKEAPKTFTGLDSDKLIMALVEKIDNSPTRFQQKIMYQLDLLGYVNVVDKKYSGICVVTDVHVEHTPKIDLYPLANGNSFYAKIQKKIYGHNVLFRGDIIQIDPKGCYQKPKYKLQDGEWVKSTTEKEWWIEKYKIVGDLQ